MLADRAPAGYCKLEIRRGRGRAQIYVQDLKPAEQEGGRYEVYLISEQDKIEPIKLTSIQVDSRGRGEKAVEFDAMNVNGTGYSLEMFHALAVVFRSESPQKGLRIGYPLVGYSSKNIKLDWSGRISNYFKGSCERVERYEGEEGKEDIEISSEQELPALEKDEEQDIELQEEAEYSADTEAADEMIAATAEEEELAAEEVGTAAKEEEVVAEEAEVEAEEVKAAAEEAGAVGGILAEQDADDLDEIADEIMDETVSGEEFGEVDEIVEKEEQEQISDLVKIKVEDMAEGKVEVREEIAEKSDTKQTYWDNVKDYYMSLFNTHRTIHPFAEDMGDAEWVRVQQQPGVYPGYYAGPYYNQTYSPYNQMYYGATYFDHYIVGLIRQQGEVKYVVYGIPSMYSMIPPTNMMGFSRWVPVRNGYGMGYWLAYIDASTGYLVYPYGKE